MHKPLLAALLAAGLAGCAVNQPAPPQLDLPAATATAAQSALLEQWWTAFDDPVLTALIDEALANNLDLRAALARIEAARALLLFSQSNLYPSVNLRAGAARSRDSQSTTQAQGQPSFGAGNDYSVGVEMSYELDVWGKYRSGALAAANDLVASQYYRETVRIAVAADVASAYFRLRAADALAVVLEETRTTRTDTVTLQRDRFEGGIIGEYDLRQAEAELSAVVADIARVRQSIGDSRVGARDADRPLAARGVHAGNRPRRVDRGRDRRAATALGTAVGTARATPGHPPRRGPPRRLRSAHPAGARRLFSEPFPDRRLRRRIGCAVQPVHVAGHRLALRSRAAPAAPRAEGDRVCRGRRHRAQGRPDGAVPANGPERLPGSARRPGDEPLGIAKCSPRRRLVASS